MRLICLVAYLIIVPTCLAQSNESTHSQGRIIGSVVNDQNEPIGHAILCTSIVRANSVNTTCGQKADAQGEFDITVPLETNRVFAQKPEAGYQHANKPMEQGVRVDLAESNPVARVTVKIGPQPAEIDLTVTDKATGKPVDSFTVRWLRIDDNAPAMFVETSKNRVFVPPNVDVLLLVQARGYKRWFYTDSASSTYPVLHLSPADQRAVAAELDPD